ncbi:MAG: IS701 family transposase [Bacillota bacterium]
MFNTQMLVGKLHEFLPLDIYMVGKTEQEPLWDHIVRTYHYLGYEKMFGPRLKYLVLYQGQPIAALSYNRAALTVGVRDSYLGWTPAQKQALLSRVVNNNRFLILPWVRICNLASYLLSVTLKRLRLDWVTLYQTEPYLVETFVDLDRYYGTCYRAANWRYLGETRGFAKVGKAFVYHGHRKGVFIYELNPKFRRLIAEDPSRLPSPPTVNRRVPNMMLQLPDWHPELITEIGLNDQEVAQLGVLLDEYLAYYQGCYNRSEQRTHGETMVKGLLSDLDRKSIEPIALRYRDEDAVRPMQFFMKRPTWDDAKMMDLYHKRLARIVNEPNGMITVDGSDFPKKGAQSVGVDRQYCGVLGKTDNCQAGVFIGYAGLNGYGLIDRRLYIPADWFREDHKTLRQQCGIPEDATFRTKPQLAVEMINHVLAKGDFQARWIGCDSAFGSNREFRLALPKSCWIFADVHANQLVWLAETNWEMPQYKGQGRRPEKLIPSMQPIPVSAIAEDGAIPWQTVVLAEGAKGPIIAQVKIYRVVEHTQGQPGDDLWLYIRQYENGRIKYALCNAPADTPLEQLHQGATLRWPIEQCFEECKSYLGMAHCEARSWNAWHRHMMFVFIAHLFLTEVRLRFKKTLLF